MLITKPITVELSAREYADLLSERLENVLKNPTIPDYSERLGVVLDDIYAFRGKVTEEVTPESLGISPASISMASPPKPRSPKKINDVTLTLAQMPKRKK